MDPWLEWNLREVGLTEEQLKRKEAIMDEIVKKCLEED